MNTKQTICWIIFFLGIIIAAIALYFMRNQTSLLIECIALGISLIAVYLGSVTFEEGQKIIEIPVYNPPKFDEVLN